MTEQRSVTVFYPSRTIGGAQVLFARVAEFLCGRPDYRVAVIDTPDGYIPRFLESRGCDFELVPLGRAGRPHLPARTTCLTALSLWNWFGTRIEPEGETRILLWDLHPFNLVEHTAFSGLYKKLPVEQAVRGLGWLEKRRRANLQRFIEQGIEQRGIVFMCGKNYRYNRRLFDLHAWPDYLPIPIVVPEVDGNPSAARRPADGLAIGWLSRLDGRKTRVLLGLLDDVRETQARHPETPVAVHVIGIGDESAAVVARARALGVSVTMAGRLEGGEIDAYVARAGIDVAFAMGTAALEFAARGVPTVLTPGGVLDDMTLAARYRWLFDSEEYNVSSEPGGESSLTKGLDEIVREIGRPGAFQRLGQRCRRYALDNHGLPAVMERLLVVLDENVFTLDEMARTGVFGTSVYERSLLAAKGVYKRVF